MGKPEQIRTEAALRARHAFLPKDFLETPEGLLFAVVVAGSEQGRVLSSLRYERTPAGLRKLTTEQGLAWLRDSHPQYLFHSPSRDVTLAGVPQRMIRRHWQPVAGLTTCAIANHNASPTAAAEVIAQSAVFLAGLLQPLIEDVGITGSHLIGGNHPDSDIDLVVYGRQNFREAQRLLTGATAAGQLHELSPSQWQATFARRGCELGFEEYLWHERRKRNKFSIAGTRLDISCVDEPPPAASLPARKLQSTVIRARVSNDDFAFTSPAVYEIEHPSIKTILVFTPTYAGQARVGEMLEAAGCVEQQSDGGLRLVIGSSREARGEYLRVIA